MPQLEVSTYISQIFWLITTFLSFWLIMDKIIIPRISETIEARKRKYNDFILKAEEINKKALSTLNKYEETLAAAKADAARQISENEAELKAFIAGQEAEMTKRLKQKVAENEEKLSDLKAEYEKIKNRLEELQIQGIISEYIRCTIIDMSNKVLAHIASKYNTVRKGVKSIMGGRVLEYEAKTIRNEGIEEGIRGTVSILEKLGIPSQTISLKIQEQYNLSPEESKKYIK